MPILANMDVNADFSEAAMLKTGKMEWTPSPMAGVERRMLDRIGGEVARATSIVRYAPGSAFSEHTHSGGEEFIVLDGVFQDEHGDYPAGTYVRNPVGTHHIPGSEIGCTIFVKLWQFDPQDQEQFSLDLDRVQLVSDAANPNVRRAVLAKRDYEQVLLEEWSPGASIAMLDSGGFEILVLDGTIALEGETFARHDWVRWPADRDAVIVAGPQGARLWIKHGHLSDIRIPEQG
ncbi:MAG: cupin domain-containing protein [Erythrobacter sp.]